MPTQGRRRFLRTFGAGATVGVAGIAGCLGDDAVANTQKVELTNDGFDPRNVEVDRKKTVFWENTSDATYGLVSATATWEFHRPLDPGKTTGYEFNSSGIYRLVAREVQEIENTETPTGPPEFTGTRMKIAVGREMQDPITE